ncbi:ATP-binding cassette domain-containing protein [candidate division KSB3 bacterium]|uniref:ATP-binding cassette domain-containing protein n=1 Tax=candidate division KSB3 bacterium TaxID=2044937 RepID=A0A9D5JWZ3_9BACT|nr:ATP-binding cassette domain-containing protein [candidate division KSB3 bacterium]MBD3325432.1 ATP-binding cassette domain-containing protein [candidate division KSB3 bacterium]
MNKDESVIKIADLTKVFGENVAVDHFNLEVQRGELFGLVGPDGAGKTTTMRMLTAIMRPTSGDAWVAGHSILREGERIKEKIGYMSQRFGLYEDLTVIENIHFYADLFLVPQRERPQRIERLLGFSNLTPFKDRLAGKLSGGMKQKLGLACALIHTPQILFLDEPTNGVDPVSRRDFWKILYDLLKEGMTIFVSTAYLDEAERCTQIGLLHEGQLLMKNDPVQVKKSLGYPMFQLWTSETRSVANMIKDFDGVKQVNIYGDSLHMGLEKPSDIDHIIEKLEEQGIKVQGQREILPSLEDIFIAQVKRQE